MNSYQIISLIILFFWINEASFSSLSTKSLGRHARQLSSKCVCGIENLATKSQRIIAGTEIKPELRFPWLVPLAYRNGSFFCSGTLINSRYILTSAHCFRYTKQDAAGELRYMISSDAIIVPERYTSNVLVGLGVHYLTNDQNFTDTHNDKIKPSWEAIDYAIVHRFYENFDSAIRHDIALVRLREEIDFDRFKWLRPICLPNEDEFELDKFNEYQLNDYIEPKIVDSKNLTIIHNRIGQRKNKINVQLNGSNYYQAKLDISNKNQNINRIDSNQMIYSIPDQFSNYNFLGGNEPNMVSNMFNANDNADSHLHLIINNETIKSIDRVNSKRFRLDKAFKNNTITFDRIGRNLVRNKDTFNELFYVAGWGSIQHNFDNSWKLSKVPMWIQLEMLTRNECANKNGDKVKWNFICAKAANREQEITVGDSGGPLFGQLRRRNSNMKNRSKTTTTPKPTTIQQKTTQKMTTTTETTKHKVIKYITKAPLEFKLLSKKPQKQVVQTSNQINNLMTKVKENTNRHFYSAMVYEDLFKTFNLPHENSDKTFKDEMHENKYVIDDDLDNQDKSDNPNSIRTIDTIRSIEKLNITNSIKNQLDLSTSNYVQLGITSWSSYLNLEISMFTDIRAYMNWIKRNTQDANYCIANPSKLKESVISISNEKPYLPDTNSNLECGAERLGKVSYPWINSLYMDNKFLGNCVYFYSNFVICSDIFAEQISQDINSLVHRFSVQFYYPNYRFKAKNIVNRLISSSTVNRREYIIIQLEDPDNKLPKDASNRKLNRALIDNQINKNNAKASCIATRDYPMNEESSNLVTFYLFSPGEYLIKTQLKLVARRRCKQLAPNFVTSRFLCAQIGSSEEINVSKQLMTDSDSSNFNSIPNRLDASQTTNATSLSFAMKLKNFFRIQSNRLNSHYLNVNNILKSDSNDLNRQKKILIEKISEEPIDNRADDSSKEIFEGQPVFHKIAEQYTLVGFSVKAPFPSTSSFRRNNLILLLDLKKFRFQLVTKLIKSSRI